ncbi:hypothetical protein CN880_02295 [Ochrobactrum sp. 720/2009]|nr:hypothetical protein CN880_02295 [Ochrobactrum sp. 720/2009]PJT22013.1 hypothetical protein CN879_11955 [Ochrobactrum sp. 715/2009]PJT32845.1 hypothetical protein CN877_15500 [Ochrobactrum sp. 689/2009]
MVIFEYRNRTYLMVREYRNADKLPFAAAQGDFWTGLQAAPTVAKLCPLFGGELNVVNTHQIHA